MKQFYSFFYLYVPILTNQRTSNVRSNVTGNVTANSIKPNHPQNKKTMNTNMLGEITNEVVPWEVNQQCNLMNAIFSQVVNQRVQELQKEKCCGCKVDHPSQRRHKCLMMSEEEGWKSYGLEAIEHVLQQEILWKQFREAIRIMRLIPHKHAINHFQKLSSNHKTTLELLRDLMFKTSLSEYQDILGYLHYWQKEH